MLGVRGTEASIKAEVEVEVKVEGRGSNLGVEVISIGLWKRELEEREETSQRCQLRVRCLESVGRPWETSACPIQQERVWTSREDIVQEQGD